MAAIAEVHHDWNARYRAVYELNLKLLMPQEGAMFWTGSRASRHVFLKSSMDARIVGRPRRRMAAASSYPKLVCTGRGEPVDGDTQAPWTETANPASNVVNESRPGSRSGVRLGLPPAGHRLECINVVAGGAPVRLSWRGHRQSMPDAHDQLCWRSLPCRGIGVPAKRRSCRLRRADSHAALSRTRP